MSLQLSVGSPMHTVLGLAVVVVEDEPMLLMLLEDMLDEIGCRLVASAATVGDGLAAVDEREFDIAILDVHLGRDVVWPLADHLVEEGKPFVLASGDDGRLLQDRYPSATILAKPYELDTLTKALSDAVRPGPTRPLTPDAASE